MIRQPRKTILVVDDDTSVRRMVRTMLRNGGYMVLEAASGEQALGVCRACEGQIDLVIIDILMPGMGGLDLASLLNPASSGMKILYISGLGGSVAVQSLTQGSPAQILLKPFGEEELLGRVGTLLASE